MHRCFVTHPGDLILTKLMWIIFRSHGKQFFYALPLFSLISHCLHKIVRVEAEGMNDCFLLAYPAMYSCYA